MTWIYIQMNSFQIHPYNSSSPVWPLRNTIPLSHTFRHFLPFTIAASIWSMLALAIFRRRRRRRAGGWAVVMATVLVITWHFPACSGIVGRGSLAHLMCIVYISDSVRERWASQLRRMHSPPGSGPLPGWWGRFLCLWWHPLANPAGESLSEWCVRPSWALSAGSRWTWAPLEETPWAQRTGRAQWKWWAHIPQRYIPE